MQRISDDYFDGFKVNGAQVRIAIEGGSSDSRHKLVITYGTKHVEVVDMWTYASTASSPNLQATESCDTLRSFMFVDSEPMPGWFNGHKVMFIHPDKDNSDKLLIWCTNTDEVEWFIYEEYESIPDITTSQGYAHKFGLWSVETYKHIRSQKGRTKAK